MHVAQISFFNDPQGRTPVQLLEAWASLVDVAEAAASADVRVSVLQASIHSESLTRNGVRYHFRPFGRAPTTARQRAEFEQELRAVAPDVIHVHGLDFGREVCALGAVTEAPILLQDHADKPPRPWRRMAWRRGVSAAAAVMFCAKEQARPFAAAGLLKAGAQLYEVPESTSRFCPGDRAQARQATGVDGDPLVLWVGHLDTNKDPLTVLNGVSAAMRLLPGLQLYCCFGAAPLRGVVEERIAADPALSTRTHLLGRVPHEHIEMLMRAADLFVLGSHREGSGYSLIEALACALPPVVTDIPSFRALTGAGVVGRLWPCGDAGALCAALLAITPQLGAEMRTAVHAHFERELSRAALGRKLAAVYGELVEQRRVGSAKSQRQAREPCAVRSS
jgi:glycosyltransferase involved in cell wall biosynthesis